MGAAHVFRRVVLAAIAVAAAGSCSDGGEEAARPTTTTTTTTTVTSTTRPERVVYLATQEVFADALVAGPAAASGALFLVPPDQLPASVADALRARRPCRVVAAGGASAIQPHVIRAAEEACR